MKPLLCLFSLSIFFLSALADDIRNSPPKDLNGFFPFDPPSTLEEWKKRKADLTLRLQVATGLYPMPTKTPLNAVIHGKITRPGFTVEKVYFESVPGFFVTGLLFRPENSMTKKCPAVLNPHGHGGRLQDHGKSGGKGVLKQIEIGAEKFEESGRMPKIARCATLARLGCVTFLYDMIGYADNLQLSYKLAHQFSKRRSNFERQKDWGLYSAQAEMRMFSIFGLQTWNSIRALDFMESLPDVDPARIAVTGGSGGGTQTILLGALDDRPIASFPNGMVSSSMQGGCTCENASLLRIGTGNVEMTALFAPKPQGMTAADDWTREMLIEGKGFHELKKLYALYGKPEYVICPDLTHFKHNYNYVTRAIMYSWFNRHLKLGHPEPVIEQDFKLLSKEEHVVWNKHHPTPEGGDAYERRLMAQLDERDHRLLENLEEKKKAETMIKAWQTIVGRSMEDALEHNYQIEGNKLTNQSMKEEIELQIPENLPSAPKIVVLLGASAKKSVDQAVKPVLFRQNQDGPTQKVSNSREFAGYTHGYNHSRLARQIHDLLSVIAFLKSQTDQPIEIHAGQGFEAQAIVASYLAGNLINKVIVESSNFRFSQITNYHAPRFLPGAIKYGDLDFLIQTLGKKLKRS
jgi:hypothetical protein